MPIAEETPLYYFQQQPQLEGYQMRITEKAIKSSGLDKLRKIIEIESGRSTRCPVSGFHVFFFSDG